MKYQDIADEAMKYAKVKKLEIGIDTWAITDIYTDATTAERERMMAFIAWKGDKCKKIPYSNSYRYNDVWYTLRELHEIFLKENK